MVLWEGDVEKMTEGKSYAIDNANVKLYEGVKYLSVTNETAVDEVGDIGDVSGSSARVIEQYSICGEVVSCSKVTQCVLWNVKESD